MLDLMSAVPAPLWALFGIALTKAVDWVLARRKTHLDQVTATYDAVNVAQKQLVDGLFQQVSALQSDLAAMKQQLSHCEEQHKTATLRVDELQHEITLLKAAIRPH
jgi:predicted  nucleic acid-binding Zn-ribbon protein